MALVPPWKLQLCNFEIFVEKAGYFWFESPYSNNQRLSPWGCRWLRDTPVLPPEGSGRDPNPSTIFHCGAEPLTDFELAGECRWLVTTIPEAAATAHDATRK
jgi:hypothetical protein